MGRLESVQLPEVGTFRGDARPTLKYSYPSASLNEPEQVTDFIDVGTNLTGITIPDDVPYGRAPRVSFSYETAGANRDRVKEQKWATGETASVQAPPTWAKRIHTGVSSTTSSPFVYAQPITATNAFLTSVATGETREQTLFEIEDLYLAAADESRTNMAAGFHAYPFTEPANGKVYARACERLERLGTVGATPPPRCSRVDI